MRAQFQEVRAPEVRKGETHRIEELQRECPAHFPARRSIAVQTEAPGTKDESSSARQMKNGLEHLRPELLRRRSCFGSSQSMSAAIEDPGH